MKRPLPAMSLLLLFLVGSASKFPTQAQLPAALQFEQDTLNRIEVTVAGKRIAINRGMEPDPDLLLLTHVRRDTIRAARSSRPGETFAPERSRIFLEAGTLWSDWWEKRFDYYAQQVRQWPEHGYAVDRLLPPAETDFSREGIFVETIDSPGYTRDGMTYLMTLDDQRVAFVGDLLLAGGKVRDLYSFQDEIRDAKIGGYHGYLGRLGLWIGSLERLASKKPDLLVPSRGPISHSPEEDIQSAIRSARQIYRNYLSTNALHWYFGEERMNTCAEIVLGPDHGLVPPELCEHVELPEWCRHIGTTKLLVSDSGAAFALDVGGPRSLKTLIEFEEQGLIGKLDGIFATHPHNDHTAAIAQAATHFDCPVYALPEVAAVLASPGKWFLPGVSANTVPHVTAVKDGETMKWQDFSFTFRFFPGQMHDHGALLVERSAHEPVFFIGDSFSPSGIDDYCMMNRNLMREDTGYLSCFRIVRELPPATWLVNQHIPHLFRFTETDWETLESRYRKRIEMLASFCAVEDPNFAIDEQWARFFPYGQEVVRGDPVTTSVVLENHATQEQQFTVRIRRGETVLAIRTDSLPARSSNTMEFSLDLSAAAEEMTVLTADIERSRGMIREGHCETLIRWSAP